MDKITWNDAFEVGQAEMDAQHRTLLEIIDKIRAGMEQSGDKHFIGKLLMELLKYSEFHFCSEENMMAWTRYPNLIEHKHVHEKLLAELRCMMATVTELRTPRIQMDNFIGFLVHWFADHTRGMDLHLATHLKSATLWHTSK
jgi:hemerythrin-like metal-binding protein